MTIVSNAPTTLDIRCQRPAGGGQFNVSAYRGTDQIAALARSVNTPGEAFAEACRITDAAAIAAGPCPTWCITGPHEAFPTDPDDDGARLHSGADATLTVPSGSGPVEVAVTPQWLQGSDEPPTVHVNLAEDGATVAEMLLTADQAEAYAAQLVAAAAALRTTIAGERVSR